MSTNGSINYESFLATPDEDITLPSGMPCTLRSPSPWYFLQIGKLPGRLARVVREGATMADIDRAAREDSKASIEGMTKEEWIDTEAKADLLICDVFVKPHFSLTPRPHVDPPEFHPSRLRLEDRSWVLRWVTGRLTGGAQALETFRNEPRPDAIGRGGEQDVGETTGAISGVTGLGVGV